ncbi:MAG TPA: hypothetical protein VKV28_17360 [Candidatus Binataceae bacterium]|nr:hypothetical protein [Candidatus Binataceae bacterium]
MVRRRPVDGAGEIWVVVADVFIGFLVVVILITLPRAPTNASPHPHIAPTPPALDFLAFQREYQELKVRLEQLAMADADLKKRVADLQQQIDQLKGLHSPALPTCKYTGLATGPLFDAEIQGGDRFEIDGQAYSLEQISVRFRQQLDAADKGKCRHTVGVCYNSGLSVPDANTGRQALQRLFYVGELSGQRCAALFPK